MNISLPYTDHELTRVIAQAGNWSARWHLSRFQRECNVVVPDDIPVDEVGIRIEFLDQNGKVLEQGPVVKIPVKKPVQPAPQPKPKPERSKKWRERQGPKEAIAVPEMPEMDIPNEHDAGRTQCIDRRWTQEPNSDEVLPLG